MTEERPIVGLWPTTLAASVALLGSGVTFGCGAGGLMMLMLAMNGFSESQATPVFIGAIGLLLLANAGVIAVLSAAVLRHMEVIDHRFAKALVAVYAIGLTVLPVVCVGGFLFLRAG